MGWGWCATHDLLACNIGHLRAVVFLLALSSWPTSRQTPDPRSGRTPHAPGEASGGNGPARWRSSAARTIAGSACFSTGARTIALSACFPAVAGTIAPERQRRGKVDREAAYCP
jgi:hypothetical protein